MRREGEGDGETGREDEAGAGRGGKMSKKEHGNEEGEREEGSLKGEWKAGGGEGEAGFHPTLPPLR